MKTILLPALLIVLCAAPVVVGSDANVNIRNGVPATAFMVAYGQQNPEREYLHPYYEAIWKTVQDEKLPERIFGLMIDALPSQTKEQVDSTADELHTIFDQVDWSAIADTKEVAYAQVFELPQSHHLFVVRLPSSEVASKLEAALIQTGEMIQRRAGKAVESSKQDVENVAVYSLESKKIKEFPFSPAVARVGDVIIISSSAKVARQSVRSLVGGGPSKFDDARLKTALKQLPEPEDALVFYDARQQFSQLKEIGSFIREKAPNDPKAGRVAGVIQHIMNEIAILDFQVAVEYTDNHKILKNELLQLTPDARDKKLYQAIASGKPFENWERWVPADAQAYSLNTGINLHALYETVMQFVQQEFPEAAPKLEQFEAKQKEWGVNIDSDILQAFSGESVKLKLPAATPSTFGGQDTVIALRCEKPERIRELIQQAMTKLAATPYCQTQNLKFEASEDVEGFEEISVNMLLAFGVRPTIGFHDGWMIVATSPGAAQKVLKTLAGDEPSIATTERFKKFGIKVKDPVAAIRYTDIGAGTRHAALLIRQAGLIAPTILVSAGIKDAKTQKLLQDATGLLPSIANVVEKFNFIDARLAVAQRGEADGSVVTQTVTLIRELKPEKHTGEKN